MIQLSCIKSVRRLGLTASHYDTHSFHIGTATSSKDAHIPDVMQRNLEDDKVMHFKNILYRSPESKLASLSKQLAT